MPNEGKRKVIATITDAFAPFHREVVEGLRENFSKAGYGTLAVAGRDVRNDRLIDLGAHDGESFGSRLDVAGAIVVCGATPPGMSDTAIAAYVDRLTDGPVVSFGIALPGVASATISFEAAIRDLMKHMVADPTRRRFAFVRGFPGDPHSEIREAGFRSGLAAAAIPVHEELIVNGNYSVADAISAVRGLLDSGCRFDGLIAANDDMAIGAITALASHGLSVPSDVIVAGFDDSFASFTSAPSLTSVQVNTRGLAACAAGVLLDAIRSGSHLDPSFEVQIESGLVIRESSRQTRPMDTALNTDSTRAPGTGLGQTILERWEAARAPSHLPVEKLAAAAEATLLTGDQSITDACRSSYPRDEIISDRNDVVWMGHALKELRGLIVDNTTTIGPLAGTGALVQQLREIDRWFVPAGKRIETERKAHQQLQERLVMRLAACSDTNSLWETLRSGLHSFGMKNAWVAVNADEGASPEADSSAMRLAFSLGHDPMPLDQHFDRSQVLPERFRSLLEHDIHVLVPLRAGESDIGYIVLEPTGEYLLELEAIASGIARVLRHVDQVGDLEHQTARLRLANEALDHLARKDSLTGLANRKLFLEHLERQLDHVRENEALSILFFDLDGFKLINDTLGHEAGDHLLRIVANRVRAVISDQDMFARLGGDEFIILVRHARGSERAREVAASALRAISNECTILGQRTVVSASLGISEYPNDGETTDKLVRHADAAMYSAKASGKNQYRRYADGLAEAHNAEVELRDALRIGLEQDEFYLEYQPRVCLATGNVRAFEAFLRWDPSTPVADEDRRPDRFVQVAEQNGLISALDSVSLDRACREARRWADAGYPIPVSVNVSVKRLQEADIVAQVVDALERYGLAPELLQLEFSEQALMDDPVATASKLALVRDVGVRCHVDDYGTGNSSVSNLAEFPVDMLKIDESIIAGIDATDVSAEKAKRNVRAIVALAASLGLTTIAEGVESETQKQFLLDSGCVEGQGFALTTRLAPITDEAAAVWPGLPNPKSAGRGAAADVGDVVAKPAST